MKKTLLIFLFVPLISFGQNKSFELGLLFGGSYNSLPDATMLNEETLRPMGGFLAQYNFTSLFSIKTKLLYHIKGASTQNLVFGSGAAGSGYLDFHYLTLPLLAQFNFGKNKWQVFCNSGGYVGYLIKHELVDHEGTATNDLINGTGKIDLGIMLGSGISFRFSERIKIVLESSFDYGFGKQAITASTGIIYNIPIKKKTFNGMSTLDCPDYNESTATKEKKISKWRLVLYKDGQKVGGRSKKSKRGKSRLFKKKD